MQTAAAWRFTHSYSVAMPEVGIRPLPCHGTFGQFRTQLGSGGNGREQSGKSRAMYAWA